MTTMFKLDDASLPDITETCIVSSFISLLKSKWDETHSKEHVFRYKIDNLKEKMLDNKYLLQLNADRGIKRRTPQQIDNICQPFDSTKFNFTKVSNTEVLFKLIGENDDVHTILVNVSPISLHHSLLCPSINKCLPQVVTQDSLELALRIMFIAQDRDMKIGFNSLCALASVNHLHYHLLFEKHTLPIQTWKCDHIKGLLYKLDKTFLVPGLCMQVSSKDSIKQISKEAYKVIEHFVANSIAHNILLTRGVSFDADGSEVIRLIIWPRKSCAGVKQLSAFNVAVCELSGWFPIFDEIEFEALKIKDLENELKKWKYDEFDLLCDIMKKLF